MALVDPRVLETVATPPKDSVGKVLQRLDDEMQAIINRRDLQEREKVTFYNQILERYNDIDEKHVQEPTRVILEKACVDKEPESTASSGSVEIEIVDSAPNTLKRKAQRLVEKLKADSTVDWNDRGEFIYNGEVVTGSNMVDLVNGVLRKRKSVVPVGWKRFANYLKRLNVSNDLIGNPELWQYMQSGSPNRPPTHQTIETFSTVVVAALGTLLKTCTTQTDDTLPCRQQDIERLVS